MIDSVGSPPAGAILNPIVALTQSALQQKTNADFALGKRSRRGVIAAKNLQRSTQTYLFLQG